MTFASSAEMALPETSMEVNARTIALTALMISSSIRVKWIEPPWMPDSRMIPLLNASPNSNPNLMTFAHHAFHGHGDGLSAGKLLPALNAFAAKNSWKDRCTACISRGSSFDRVSSGSLSLATRSSS
eukprot:5350205-Prymnesium_polylepis.1